MISAGLAGRTSGAELWFQEGEKRLSFLRDIFDTERVSEGKSGEKWCFVRCFIRCCAKKLREPIKKTIFGGNLSELPVRSWFVGLAERVRHVTLTSKLSIKIEGKYA